MQYSLLSPIGPIQAGVQHTSMHWLRLSAFLAETIGSLMLHNRTEFDASVRGFDLHFSI